MRFAKLTTAVLLGVVIPIALSTVWTLVLNNLAVKSVLRPIGSLARLLAMLGYLATTVLGFSLIVREADWKNLEHPERQLLVGVGVLYFPAMWYVMFFLAFWVVGKAYGLSL